MLNFESYVNRKEAQDYNEKLAKATEGYGNLMQIGVSDNKQLFKIVINPDSKRTICFVAESLSGSLGLLNFLEKQYYVPKTKKIIIIPLITKKSNFFDKPLEDEAKIIWESIENEKIELFTSFQEDDQFYVYFNNDRELAEDLIYLAKNYFKKVNLVPPPYKHQKNIEDRITDMGISCITTKVPTEAKLDKKIEYFSKSVRMVINGA
jgi:hypothetical protein